MVIKDQNTYFMIWFIKVIIYREIGWITWQLFDEVWAEKFIVNDARPSGKELSTVPITNVLPTPTFPTTNVCRLARMRFFIM